MRFRAGFGVLSFWCLGFIGFRVFWVFRVFRGLGFRVILEHVGFIRVLGFRAS